VIVDPKAVELAAASGYADVLPLRAFSGEVDNARLIAGLESAMRHLEAAARTPAWMASGIARLMRRQWRADDVLGPLLRLYRRLTPRRARDRDTFGIQERDA
jgi:hypothetical protein